jgi:hypothetical protein
MAVSRLPLDDIIKGVLKAVKGGKKSPTVKKIVKKGSEADLLSPMSKRKFDKVYGKGSAKQVAEQTKRNARKK